MEPETLPAAPRAPRPTSQLLWRHPQRGRPRTQRSPDRHRSDERRRRLAWSGSLPGHLAGSLTVSDMAVLRVVADEHPHRKFCELCLDQIAARAGVCRKTAKRALQRSKGLGLITIKERPVRGRKNLPNLIKIKSPEWLAWLENRSKRQSPGTNNSLAHIPVGGHFVAPTYTSQETAGETSKGSPTEISDERRSSVGEAARSANVSLLRAAWSVPHFFRAVASWRPARNVEARR